MYRFLLLAGAASLAFPMPLQAQTVTAPDSFHDQSDENIVVTAPFARELGTSLSGVSVLSGTELTRDIRTNIGDTLSRQPGVSSTSFGPNASRPVLRGFQGDRVRILTDGIGSFDVSSTSVDHAVVINPLTAERIEVLRGPSALLFGSAAVGGVVNVIDNRIPRRIPDEPVHVDAYGAYGSAANERSLSGAASAPVTDKIVVHMDGSYSKTDDLETGGYILTPALRAEAAASDDPEIAALADLKGRLPNSAGRSWEVAGGAAVITDRGNLGFSVSRYDSLYGVPVRYALDPESAAEAVRLDVRQTRADVRGELEIGGGFIDRLRLRGGWADYRHDELEESGDIGTSFFNDAYEARLELVQAERNGWRGASGGQMFLRNFEVIGAEKFLPKSEAQQYGLFTLQEFDMGAVKAEAGGRYEHSILSAVADAVLGNPDMRRTFDAFSGSLGASVAVADGWRIGLNGSRAERAPSPEEAFANGPHAGTQAFEIGDPDLAKEKSWGVEATLRGRGPGYSLDLSAYHSWFSDYIFDTRTGDIKDGLPVYQVGQADARYWGLELEGSVTLAERGAWTFVADGLADYVRAKITSAGSAPRIPPLRLLGGIEAQSDVLQGRVEVEWSDSQKRVAAFETPTDGFTMVNASLAWRPFDGRDTRIILAANNIFDVTARRHASFLKDYAPLAGRDLRLTVRAAF